MLTRWVNFGELSPQFLSVGFALVKLGFDSRESVFVSRPQFGDDASECEYGRYERADECVISGLSEEGKPVHGAIDGK